LNFRTALFVVTFLVTILTPKKLEDAFQNVESNVG
jgi:hypothetical protein